MSLRISFENILIEILGTCTDSGMGDLFVSASALDSRSRGLDLRPGWVVVLCSWEKNFTFTVPVTTQECNWILGHHEESLMKCRG